MNSENLQKLNIQLRVKKKFAVNNRLEATNRPKYISKAKRKKKSL
ncbi:MAG: DUF2986 domain-containing protein [Gammaproteobacteria bacterium]|nr:MAG: DUF2986 domain-containing protein [Gammaproteobacteria bacterium]